MFRKNLLRAKIVEKGLTAVVLCQKIGMCEASFYRKVAQDGNFTRSEIEAICKALGLTSEERDGIFFAGKLA